MKTTESTYPERIRAWVKNQFAPKYEESVTADLINVAAGNREGNKFEKSALASIFGKIDVNAHCRALALSIAALDDA